MNKDPASLAKHLRKSYFLEISVTEALTWGAFDPKLNNFNERDSLKFELKPEFWLPIFIDDC